MTSRERIATADRPPALPVLAPPLPPIAAAARSRRKRAFDVGASLVGLFVLFPVLGLVAVAIMIDDPGPPFFRQARLGLGGRSFRLLKFRSMRVGASDLRGADGASVTMSGDPRVTRIGGWLRRTSIDELPQLWNVVRGEMSLVGPRPDQADQLALYAEGEHLKLAVRPGLTGAAQVLGRNARSWRDRKRLDRWYVRRWSHALDARLLCLTIGVLVRPQGIETHAELPPSHHPT